MHWSWSKRGFVVACALVFLGLAPLACLLGWYFIGNPGPVSMTIPLQQGTYSVAFRIIWRRVSELFGARHWLQRAELRVKATLASPELKVLKTFNSFKMSRLTRRLAKKLAPCTPLNPEILRQIIPKLGAI
jgi:hypothetical protein